jgi:hypothetical protein
MGQRRLSRMPFIGVRALLNRQVERLEKAFGEASKRQEIR